MPGETTRFDSFDKDSKSFDKVKINKYLSQEGICPLITNKETAKWLVLSVLAPYPSMSMGLGVSRAPCLSELGFSSKPLEETAERAGGCWMPLWPGGVWVKERRAPPS